MNSRDALHRLRRALARLAREPQARLRLGLVNDPPGVESVALVGITATPDRLTLHLAVHLEESAVLLPERNLPCSKSTSV